MDRWHNTAALQAGARGGHALIPRRSDPESSLTEKCPHAFCILEIQTVLYSSNVKGNCGMNAREK